MSGRAEVPTLCSRGPERRKNGLDLQVNPPLAQQEGTRRTRCLRVKVEQARWLASAGDGERRRGSSRVEIGQLYACGAVGDRHQLHLGSRSSFAAELLDDSLHATLYGRRIHRPRSGRGRLLVAPDGGEEQRRVAMPGAKLQSLIRSSYSGIKFFYTVTKFEELLVERERNSTSMPSQNQLRNPPNKC